MSERIVLGMLIPTLKSRAFAEEFLKELSIVVPRLRPAVYGSHEPLRTQYMSWEDAVCWDYSFLWRLNKGLRSDGAAFMGNRLTHGNITMSVVYEPGVAAELAKFIESVVVTMGASFAYLHCVTESEASEARGVYDRWYPLSIGLTTHDLRKGIPELPWLTVFGREYRDLIGEKVLRDIKAGMSHALGNDHWALSVTSSFDDLFADFDRFQFERESIKRQIGLRYFQGYEELAREKCLPDFAFE